MANRVTTVLSQLIESVLAVAGIRVGAEESPHTTERLPDGIEIRHYQPRIAAETVVDADERQALEQGFRRLAGYIFGGNHAGSDIAMTAPVVQAPAGGQQIAMTTPVARAADAGHGWAIRFFMPSKWTLATLPEPDDDRIRLIEVPAETMAVLRFSGLARPDVLAARTAELHDALQRNGVHIAGNPVAWFYDPPWTLPFRRRNEVAVAIAS